MAMEGALEEATVVAVPVTPSLTVRVVGRVHLALTPMAATLDVEEEVSSGCAVGEESKGLGEALVGMGDTKMTAMQQPAEPIASTQKALDSMAVEQGIRAEDVVLYQVQVKDTTDVGVDVVLVA